MDFVTRIFYYNVKKELKLRTRTILGILKTLDMAGNCSKVKCQLFVIIIKVIISK